MELDFRAFTEQEPDEQWRSHFERLWPRYRRWYLQEGDEARPSLRECRAALERHAPSMLETWERLVELVGGGDLEARFLSQWRPPAVSLGCSQLVVLGPGETDADGDGGDRVLVRNYDHDPRLCEGLILHSAWNGAPVIANTDCLVGALDGMNAAGLVVALAFGGRRTTGGGFSAPFIVRHVLESCANTRSAVALLREIRPVMAYSFSLLDAAGEHAVVHARPEGSATVSASPACTNHQGSVAWPEHAWSTASVERERILLDLAARGAGEGETLEAFQAPPLFAADQEPTHRTVYTALFRPARREVEWIWPGLRWTQSLTDFRPGLVGIEIRPADPVSAPGAPRRLGDPTAR